MTAKAGQEARNTGDLRCQQCGELVHVEAGMTIPNCPVCNSETFSQRKRPIKT